MKYWVLNFRIWLHCTRTQVPKCLFLSMLGIISLLLTACVQSCIPHDRRPKFHHLNFLHVSIFNIFCWECDMHIMLDSMRLNSYVCRTVFVVFFFLSSCFFFLFFVSGLFSRGNIFFCSIRIRYFMISQFHKLWNRIDMRMKLNSFRWMVRRDLVLFLVHSLFSKRDSQRLFAW